MYIKIVTKKIKIHDHLYIYMYSNEFKSSNKQLFHCFYKSLTWKSFFH